MRPIPFAPRRPNPVFGEEYAIVRGVVADARRKAGLSQAQLAAMLGKAKSHVALIERGQRRIDTLELYRMARCFGLPSEALFLRISRALDRRAAQPSPAAARLPGA